ncbi:hypothetical protein VSH64_13970 [Amycolatopsis rhabdoformis]|uniref:Uncharacterized protein n=1 Tax=Amycolatopsis rhabdoformis TaxID=1448059 RepID=A0ABZ1IGH0_9PSEU|nr:hypothetical protein [Amycolatopsis rhabdoformis]WSE33208.1 hypothetical protein VSH64_13970 [Amycolatopsis rhabdoformis]
MTFSATWTPGPEAVAGVHQSGSAIPPGLVVYLDPDSLAITPPADPALWPRFAEFLRQLRDGAEQLAAVVEARAGLARDGDDD